MTDIIPFGGTTYLDLPVERVLNAALEAGLETVTIVGREADGTLYFASSSASLQGVFWDLTKAKQQMMEFPE